MKHLKVLLTISLLITSCYIMTAQDGKSANILVKVEIPSLKYLDVGPAHPFYLTGIVSKFGTVADLIKDIVEQLNIEPSLKKLVVSQMCFYCSVKDNRFCERQKLPNYTLITKLITLMSYNDRIVELDYCNEFEEMNDFMEYCKHCLEERAFVISSSMGYFFANGQTVGELRKTIQNRLNKLGVDSDFDLEIFYGRNGVYSRRGILQLLDNDAQETKFLEYRNLYLTFKPWKHITYSHPLNECETKSILENSSKGIKIELPPVKGERFKHYCLIVKGQTIGDLKKALQSKLRIFRPYDLLHREKPQSDDTQTYLLGDSLKMRFRN